MVAIICKIVAFLLIYLLMWLVGKLYEVFEFVPKVGEYKGAVAFGLLAEVALIILLVIKIITG